MDFVDWVISSRTELGWSQSRLARESGVDASTISVIEARLHTPRPSTRSRIRLAIQSFRFDDGQSVGRLDALAARVRKLEDQVERLARRKR